MVADLGNVDVAREDIVDVRKERGEVPRSIRRSIGETFWTERDKVIQRF